MKKFVAFLSIFAIIISLGCASMPPGPAGIKKSGMKPVNSAQHYTGLSEREQKKYFGTVYRAPVNTLPPVSIAPARYSPDVYQAKPANTESMQLASNTYLAQNHAAFDDSYSPPPDQKRSRRVKPKSNPAPNPEPKQIDRDYSPGEQPKLEPVAYAPSPVYRAQIKHDVEPASLPAAPQNETPTQTPPSAVTPRIQKYIQRPEGYNEWCIVCNDSLG